MWVLRTGEEADGGWREEVRDPFRDYREFFRRDPPPIAAVGFIADTDQTGASVISELRAIDWESRSGTP